MKNINQTVFQEMLFDCMAQQDITLKQFCVAFFKSRVKNTEYIETFVSGLEEELKVLKITDSRDMHEDLFKELDDNSSH